MRALSVLWILLGALMLAGCAKKPTTVPEGAGSTAEQSGTAAGQGEGQIVRLRLAPPDPALERAHWANAAAWGGGLLVFVALLGIGWYSRQRVLPGPPHQRPK